MTLEKKYGDILVTIYDIPEAITQCMLYDFRYEWHDTANEYYASGYIGAHGWSVIDYDGCSSLPTEVRQLLEHYGFSTDNV